MALTDTFVRQVKHSGKPAGDKYADGGGLYLLVNAAGKYWRMKYRFAGKEKKLALGVYPAVSLAKARKRRDDARELLADGQDPGEAKRQAKIAQVVAATNTFEAVAREYHAKQKDDWSEGHAKRWIERMEKDLFPWIGRLPIQTITPPMLLDALQRVERRGVNETAHKLRSGAGQVFRYGVQTGRCERDVSADLRDALKPLNVKHMAAILEPSALGGFLRASYTYTGYLTTKAALQLAPMLFQRPGNIRAMEWAWVDLAGAMLTIPAQNMKRRKHEKINGRPHLVPLAPQAVAIFRELQPLTGGGRYVFPSVRDKAACMSNSTINSAMRTMGFDKDTVTGHGFRATAKTMLMERLQGIPLDVIERQLAHKTRDPLGGAYDRAEFMEQRRKMMREWADYLDWLRKGAEVIQFPAAKQAGK